MSSAHRPRRFPRLIGFRTPEAVAEALILVSQRQFTTPSEYVRRAVLRSLQADGESAIAPDKETRTQ